MAFPPAFEIVRAMGSCPYLPPELDLPQLVHSPNERVPITSIDFRAEAVYRLLALRRRFRLASRICGSAPAFRLPMLE